MGKRYLTMGKKASVTTTYVWSIQEQEYLEEHLVGQVPNANKLLLALIIVCDLALIGNILEP